MKKNKFVYFFVPAISVLFLVFGVIIFPSESISAAREGLDIWTKILIPSLLPFIIGANLIVSLKIVDVIGFVINPITRFIFNVSGKSALVFVISTVSGYPVGAKLASELRINKDISKSEAQRLASFCSTSGPLFIIGAVATGMFANPSLGYVMLICHYLGAILIGILFRNYGNESIRESRLSTKSSIMSTIDSRATSNDQFFVLFGSAVLNGVNTMLVVGGFVIIFSVVFQVLSLFNIISAASYLLHIPLSLFGISNELCYAFISGLFEITIGCNKIANITSSPEILKASLSSFLIGFSGLSILAQCSNFLANTDIKISLYIFSKFMHGLFAGVFTFLLYPLANSAVFTSSFIDLHTNSISHYYNINYKVFLPAIIIIYVFLFLVFMENKITKKES